MARIQRQVMFDPKAFQVVKKTAVEKGLGGKGFSAAANLIILEWEELKSQQKAKYGNGSAAQPAKGEGE